MTLGEMVVYNKKVARIVSIDSSKPNIYGILVYYPIIRKFKRLNDINGKELYTFTGKE